MADYGFVARLLAVLHSLPLWLFVDDRRREAMSAI
jgi:hypothetical protein